MQKKLFNFSLWWILPIVLILFLVITGSLMTQYIRNHTRQEIIKHGEASAFAVSIHVTSELNQIDYAVKSISGSPLLLPALISRGSQGIEKANEIIDRYQDAFHISVVYLMDAKGMTLASSNRNDPDSFVGKSYNFRPYFQEAMKGNLGRYLGMGTTSKKRGFYAGFPIKDRQGKIIGVAAMKKDLDAVESFFSNYPYCFLINRSGIIFLSSKPELVFKSLWPIDGETRVSLAASQQFGDQPFEAIFPKEITDGMDVVLGGNNYLVSRKLIDRNEWSVVILTPAGPINAYIYLVVMATVFACLLVVIFSGIVYVYYVNRYREIIKQSEEYIHQLADAAFEGIFIHDRGEILDLNQPLSTLLGYGRDEIIGKNLIGFIAPESRDLVLRSMQSNYDRPIEVLVNTKDGSTLTMEAYGKPIIYREKPARVIALRDISEHKKAERKLLESEEKYHLLVEKSSESIYIARDGKIVFVNKATIELYGRSSEVLASTPFTEFIYPDDRELVLSTHYKRLKGEAAPASYVFRIVTPDGTVRWVDNRSTIVSWEGRPAVLVILADITARKKAEEELQKSEEKYRTILSGIEEGYLEEDLAGNITFFNDSLCRIFGYSREEMLGLNYREFVDKENKGDIMEIFNSVYKSGTPGQRYSFNLIRKDGVMRYIEGSVSLVKDSKGNPSGFRGILRDITERRQMEEELREMSLRDQLTGLYNRRGFLTLAQQQFKLSDRTKRRMIFFFADLDGLKWINDTLGHEEGDKAIMEVAPILEETFRTSDIIARMGGDEFAVLAIDPEEIDPVIIISRLQERIDTHNNEANRRYKLSISVGCSSYDPENPSSIDELMASADELMYEQKRNKKSRLV